MSNKDNVTGSKPKIAGCIYTAPIGTAIPTDATTELAEDFKSLGYVSEDGITESESKDSSNILAFGGDVVLITEGEHSYTVQFALLEYLNIDVQKVRHGYANVSGTLEAGLTIKGNANATENRKWKSRSRNCLSMPCWRLLQITTMKIWKISGIRKNQKPGNLLKNLWMKIRMRQHFCFATG